MYKQTYAYTFMYTSECTHLHIYTMTLFLALSLTHAHAHIQGVRSVRFSLLRLTINTCNICEFLMNSSIKPHVYKVKKTNRVSYIYVSFLQKSPTLSVSLAERDKQLSLCLAFSNLIRRPGCLVEMIYTYRHIHVDT